MLAHTAVQVLCSWGRSACVTAASVCVTHTSSSPCYSTHFALQALTPRASDPTAKKKKARPAVMSKRPEAKEVGADKVLSHEEKSKEPVIPSAVVKLSQQIEVIVACYTALRPHTYYISS